MKRRWLVAIVAALAASCGGEDPVVAPPPADPACSACVTEAALENAYARLDLAAFEAMVHPDFTYVPNPVAGRPAQPLQWDAATEIALHRRMFAPQSVPAGEPAVPADLALRSITIALTQVGSVAERPDYYVSPTNPNGLDPDRWKALGAAYRTSLSADTNGPTDYQIDGMADLVMAQDLTKSPGTPGAVLLYEWLDRYEPDPLPEGDAAAEVRLISWTGFKNLYRLPNAQETEWEVGAAIGWLRLAYERRDPARYATLFHEEFSYVLYPNPMNPSQPESWGRTDEVRIHNRMFDPQGVPENEPPVPGELWLAQILIELDLDQPFTEAPEYYQSASNPGGLDPARWKAWGSEYSSDVFWNTWSQTDYQVISAQRFVVAQDLTLVPGAPGSMLVYRWQDLGSQPTSWSHIKVMFQ